MLSHLATVPFLAILVSPRSSACCSHPSSFGCFRFVLAVAEALSEWTHARIRRELGFGGKDPDHIRDMLAQRYQGSRYSFGYPACPEIAYQYAQLELLRTDRIGMVMDESEQLYPEQSTTAIVAHHPAAKYFSA